MSEASIKVYEQKFLYINPLIDMKDWPHLLFKHCKHTNEKKHSRWAERAVPFRGIVMDHQRAGLISLLDAWPR